MVTDDEQPQDVAGAEEPTAPEADVAETARAFVDEVLQTMGIAATVEAAESDGGCRVNVQGPDMGLLIGRQGSTLGALQYLVTLVVSKRVGHHVRLTLDAENYRSRREDTVRESARRWAQRVKETGQECVLDPMSPFDRRLVHTALAEDPDVFTYSEGDEPERCVVISPRSAGAPADETEQD
jgi:spoIIIJ-associated protein